MDTMDAMVKAVKEHAKRHYHSDGWDYIVETYETSEIIEELREYAILTISDAINHFAFSARLWKEQEQEYARIEGIHY